MVTIRRPDHTPLSAEAQRALDAWHDAAGVAVGSLRSRFNNTCYKVPTRLQATRLPVATTSLQQPEVDDWYCTVQMARSMEVQTSVE